MDSINNVTSRIIDAAIEVHRSLGVGLLESAYGACLTWELVNRQVMFDAEVPVPVIYKGMRISCGFKADYIVEGLVVVEIKAVDAITPVHQAQVLTYLRLTGCPVGLLLNFNSVRLTTGIKRLVHNLPEPGTTASSGETRKSAEADIGQ